MPWKSPPVAPVSDAKLCIARGESDAVGKKPFQPCNGIGATGTRPALARRLRPQHSPLPQRVELDPLPLPLRPSRPLWNAIKREPGFPIV